MEAVSLFSGIGGMDLGLERAGIRVRAQCESDEWRRGVLRKRFDAEAVYDDVREVSGDKIGRADILPGGFPCQDLSVAGRRRGLAGDRSGLFWEFARVADELALAERGGWVLLENVPGLLSSNGGRDFGLVLGALADLGFPGVGYRVLDSRYFGVPQRRRRVFVVAGPGADRVRAVLLDAEGGEGDPAARGAPRTSALGDAENGAGEGRVGRDVSHALGAKENRHDPTRQTYVVEARTGDQIETAPTVDGRGKDGPRRNQGGPIVFHTTLGVVDPDIAATLKAQRGKGGGGIGPEESLVVEAPADDSLLRPRRLTPRECERLQGLPDDWTLVPDDAPDSRRYAAIGDAVTANVAEWLGRRIVAEATR